MTHKFKKQFMPKSITFYFLLKYPSKLVLFNKLNRYQSTFYFHKYPYPNSFTGYTDVSKRWRKEKMISSSQRKRSTNTLHH